MLIIYAIITTLITTHPYKRTITKLRFKKSFHQDSSAFNCHELADCNKHTQLSAFNCHQLADCNKHTQVSSFNCHELADCNKHIQLSAFNCHQLADCNKHTQLSAFNCHQLADCNKHTQLSASFLHCNKIYSSKRKFPSIAVSRSFSFSPSQILIRPIFA